MGSAGSQTTAGSARRLRSPRGRRRVAALLTCALAALLLTASASAAPSANVTVARIGPGIGSYLVSVTNTGTVAITSFSVEAAHATSILPTPACAPSSTPSPGALTCTLEVAPGASGRVCYSGGVPLAFGPGESVLIESGGEHVYEAYAVAPAVSACPLTGFIAPKPGKCVVPNVKGKKLLLAERAIRQAHCAVGKLKRASSSHVRRGRVLGQGTRAGARVKRGTKVNLVISRGG